MPQLLRRPKAEIGVVHNITPKSASWEYVGFALHRLQPGDRVSQSTGDREVILVMVEGRAKISTQDEDFGEIGERMNVFERLPPHCIYVPNDNVWSIVATTRCTIAICSAPGKGGHLNRWVDA